MKKVNEKLDMSGERSVRLLADIPPVLIEQIKKLNVYRCAVLVPDCFYPPVGELRVGELCRLFCKKHMEEFCKKYRVELPDFPTN